MNLNYLYDIAERENIHMINATINDSNAMYCTNGKIHAIALDYNKTNTQAEEKCTLAEELGHYYCNAYYPISCTDLTLISKAEYRAKKWSITTLLPFKKIKNAIKNGMYEWEIAEEYGLTQEFVNSALDYYNNTT